MVRKTIGILYINRGVPSDLSHESFKKYYQNLLNDSSIGLNGFGPQWLKLFINRYIVVPMNIKSWHSKYKRFWSTKGFISQLEMIQNFEILQKKLIQSAPSINWVISSASLYGEHSIESSIIQMQGKEVEKLIVIPLFPQWSESSRGRVEEAIHKILQTSNITTYHLLDSFYCSEEILKAQSELLIQSLPTVMDESVAMISAFRSELAPSPNSTLPVCRKCIDSDKECRPDFLSKPYCYRYQCFKSAEMINERSYLWHWNVCFYQSQSTESKKMGPSIREVIDQLLEQEIKTVIIQCPSNIYNDIETIHDIGVELREYFLMNGGRKFILVPPLGRSVHWLDILEKKILNHCDLESNQVPIDLESDRVKIYHTV